MQASSHAGGRRPTRHPAQVFNERFQPVGARVERSLSRGAASPPGFWYAQAWDEFVFVVAGAATLGFADGTERRLAAGDYAILPAGCRHRVAWTDPDRETLWLAVHMPPPGASPAASASGGAA